MFYAAKKRNMEIFKFLLSKPNINVNVKGIDRYYSLLHYTAETNEIDYAKLLLSNPSIDVNILSISIFF